MADHSRTYFSMRDSGYEPFLSAPLWEEAGGAPLSVMSAFARLGLEPWGEADRLGRLPRHRAAAALSTSISKLPINGISLPNYVAIAARLVKLLPQFDVIGKDDTPGGAGTSRRLGGGISWWWLIAAGGVLLALQMKGWLF
jgi:hypothetical protein